MVCGYRCLVPLFVFVLCAGCAPGQGPFRSATVSTSGASSGPAPWTHLEPLDAPERFHFAIVTDRTGGHRPGVFEEGVLKVNLLQPALVMSVGDQIEGYSVDEAEIEAQWLEFEGFVDDLDMPYFFTAGNHDISNSSMMEKWKERFGPSYYHLRYKDVLFLVLNSELFEGGIVADVALQAEQMAWIEKTLAKHRNARWTFVLLHKPLWRRGRVSLDWERISAWLEDRPHTAVAGHHHRYDHATHHSHDRITLATMGGGSELRGIEYGEFDHFVWVTMTEDGPILANVMLDGVHGKNIPVREMSAARRTLRDAVRASFPKGVDGSFYGGALRLQLHNGSDVPIRLQARLDPVAGLKLDRRWLDERLDPGEQREVTVESSVDESIPVEMLAPVFSTWRLSTTLPDGAPYEVERKIPLVPDIAFDVPRREVAVQVDGSLTEWGPLRFLVEHPAEVQGELAFHRGVEDGSLRFDVSSDERFLYIAAVVQDDRVVLSGEASVWVQDALVLNLDARPEPERSENRSARKTFRSGASGRLIYTAMAPAADDESEPAFFMRETWPEEMIAAFERTEAGFRVEIAIPNAFLDEVQGEPWRELRINLGVSDQDEEGQQVVYWWLPDRFGEIAIPGTGRFRRD